MADETDGCLSIFFSVYLFGIILATVISWSLNHAIGWATLHGLFSWGYIIYYAFWIR